jgi:hypothetical protein
MSHEIFYFHQEFLTFLSKQRIGDEVRTFFMFDCVLRENSRKLKCAVKKKSTICCFTKLFILEYSFEACIIKLWMLFT